MPPWPADVCVRLRMREYYTATPLTAAASLGVVLHDMIPRPVGRSGLPYTPSLMGRN